MDALEPHISRECVERHWGGYHRRQVDSLNRQLDADMALKRLPLEELVRVAYNRGNPLPCFHAAAEAWNHEFFWLGMQPAADAAADAQGGAGDGESGGATCRPDGEVLRLLERDFGSYENFLRTFRQQASLAVGSGYVWLSARVETLVPQDWLADMKIPNSYRLQVARLVVETTANGLNPLAFDRIPLLCLDLWEHAYIHDYPDNRAAYVDAFLNHLVNWSAVGGRVERAKSVTNFWEMPTPPEALIRPGVVGNRPIPLEALKGLGQ
eukprot:TRINITY_DN18295_c0_g1_i1.p1 TRINITY_DN18295_c0_g1~~TRINITY_DN18295_c0_g1_i1.p1  ORF type:complete len:282 (+),score=-0.61 TRINITY_DN18295_c0_g1_i1:47-847(+)